MSTETKASLRLVAVAPEPGTYAEFLGLMLGNRTRDLRILRGMKHTIDLCRAKWTDRDTAYVQAVVDCLVELNEIDLTHLERCEAARAANARARGHD